MSDTPRTDNESWIRNYGKVDADFARQLERELAAATRELDNLRSDWEQADKDSFRAIYERNEAREQLRAANKEAERNMHALNGATIARIKAEEQRDRLAESLEGLLDDSYELLAERDWWKNEPRGNHQSLHADLVARIKKAEQSLTAVKGGSDE